MGFLGRLFGADPDSKIAKAEKMIGLAEFHEARWLLDGLDHPKTATLMEQAMLGLLEANLEEGRARYSAGDREGAEEHLALAREFGANNEQLRNARRRGRDSMPVAKEPEPEEETAPPGDDPIWSLPPDDPRLRYALMIERYPESLRERMLALGASFAEAAMLTENGRPADAVRALQPFTAQDDVARFERAKAAIAAEELPIAASDLMAFGDAIGHQTIGASHTAVMMVQTLVRLGRADEALTRIEPLIDASRSSAERVMLSGAEAQLLFMLGRDDEADVKTTALLRESSRDLNLVKLLARVRMRKGNRVNAMQLLEDGLNRCCSAPGKCGSQPLDLEVVRMLIVLYLEDNIEPKRVRELMADLEKHRKKPSWDDAYILALIDRNEGNPSLDQRVSTLRQGLAPNDARNGVLNKAFGA
jgi:hypothetical protein